MATIRPAFPNDRRVVDQAGLIKPSWDYFFRSLLVQLPDPGQYSVTSDLPLTFDAKGRSTVTYNLDGTTELDGILHFPQLVGDVSNSGLTTTLKSVGTPVATSFAKITTDYAGRVSATTPVLVTDLTSLLDPVYVNVSGDTMTGNLQVPSLNVTGAITSVDSVQFDTTVTPTPAVGKLAWDDQDGTLVLGMKGGNVMQQIGQETFVYALNRTGTTLLDGQVVYIDGAQGNRLTVALADASSGTTAHTTIGVLTEDILDNQQGFVTVLGLVRDIDTSAFVEGSRVWLSTTPGALMAAAPVGPNSKVSVGYVVRSHATVGSLFVKVEVSHALEELDNVAITSITDKDILTYDNASTNWINRSFNSLLPSQTGNAGEFLTTDGTTASWASVASSSEAAKLSTPRNIALSTDATGSVNFDGSANVTIPVTLANSGITAGTYRSITFNAKGLATAGTNPTTLSGYGITDALVNGNLLVVSSGGLGYGTGSGGAVVQATSRTTGVTLNKTNGAITLFSAAGSTTATSFTVTNSTVAATDTITICQKSGTNLYMVFVTNVAAGSFRVTFLTTGGVAVDAPVFNFAVVKAVIA